MKNNISQILKRGFIYALIGVFTLPLATIMFGLEKASAAQKNSLPKVDVNQNITKTDKLPPKAKDLKKDITKKETPSANPKISAIEDNLKVRNLTYQLSSDNLLTLRWTYQKSVEKYLVQWRVQDKDKNNLKYLDGNVTHTTIDNLTPSTSYVVNITAMKGEWKGKGSQILIKTFGNVPVVESASQKIIQPAIGSGVATQKRVMATTPKTPTVTPQITPQATPEINNNPTPTSSVAPQGTTSGTSGWNKVLIALSILIIAAGAALGGYYGYEWLMLRSKDKEPPASNSRW